MILNLYVSKYGKHVVVSLSSRLCPGSVHKDGQTSISRQRAADYLRLNPDTNKPTGFGHRTGSGLARLANNSGADKDKVSSNFLPNTSTIGILQSIILPSLGFRSGLSFISYAVSRFSNRVEVKDWLWSLG